jgi:hypothetical protein
MKLPRMVAISLLGNNQCRSHALEWNVSPQVPSLVLRFQWYSSSSMRHVHEVRAMDVEDAFSCYAAETHVELGNHRM